LLYTSGTTLTGLGMLATRIFGTNVSGVPTHYGMTGSGNVVMSSSPSISSPTLTGTTTAATINASGNVNCQDIDCADLFCNTLRVNSNEGDELVFKISMWGSNLSPSETDNFNVGTIIGMFGSYWYSGNTANNATPIGDAGSTETVRFINNLSGNSYASIRNFHGSNSYDYYVVIFHL
jgi:hypothetical protein